MYSRKRGSLNYYYYCCCNCYYYYSIINSINATTRLLRFMCPSRCHTLRSTLFQTIPLATAYINQPVLHSTFAPVKIG